MAEQISSSKDTGIIVVDLQADFTELKSGALAVAGTNANYIDAVEKETRRFLDQGNSVYLTQDWHPADHVSFYTNNPGTEPMQVIEIDGRPQVMWPPHCVQNTSGADILITAENLAKTVQKGMDQRFDSYSGFKDDGGGETGLNDILQQDGIKNLIIFGLATDYCVKATVLDARDAGYRVEVNLNLCRGVDPHTTDIAIEEMRAKGVIVTA